MTTDEIRYRLEVNRIKGTSGKGGKCMVVILR